MYCDTRSGVPVWYFSPPADADMRVPDFVQRCVAFLGAIGPDETGTALVPTYRGTAFWVGIANPRTSDGAFAGASTYLVTAAHVARALERRHRWFVRMNGPRGTAMTVNGRPEDRWYYHHDPSVDAAVLPVVSPEGPDGYDVQSIIWHHTFASDFDLQHRIGVGDEVFVTGLFAHVTGDKKNLPIVRMGNIAMLPGEQRIPIEEHEVRGCLVRDMEGYLIEARSIGGISGSPCFVRGTVQTEQVRHYGSSSRQRSISDIGPRASELRALNEHIRDLDRKLEEALKTRPLGVDERYSLLGLMHGHWDIPAAEKNDLAGEEGEAVNMGIAIVVPASKIIEILNRPELRNMREEAGEAHRARHQATMDLPAPRKPGDQ